MGAPNLDDGLTANVERVYNAPLMQTQPPGTLFSEWSSCRQTPLVEFVGSRPR